MTSSSTLNQSSYFMQPLKLLSTSCLSTSFLSLPLPICMYFTVGNWYESICRPSSHLISICLHSSSLDKSLRLIQKGKKKSEKEFLDLSASTLCCTFSISASLFQVKAETSRFCTSTGSNKTSGLCLWTGTHAQLHKGNYSWSERTTRTLNYIDQMTAHAS